ncbi:nuclease-related domain-containing protein [Macrococcoides canis]|uniref:NERD domain-containing protein n=1 Tax=Macrococcoides canis TaxID=1855823 RepID=A0A4R6C1T2_9STAP|nr:nuclease-related domain-containing protein [Macrococcus canis]TDM15265.1 NERD domain-containing protein [Macrococcus canis]
MITKYHETNDKLLMLYELQGRVNLTKKDYDVLMRYLSGLEGERKFLDVMCDLEGVLILWDIYLEDYSAQFDFLVIAGQYVFHFDVKHYSRVYEYKDGLFKGANGRVNKKLMLQLIGSEAGLNQFLLHHGFHYKVASRVVFMNESFQLIGDTDKYILFYYDLGRVVKYLKGSAGISDAMMRLSDTLIAHHGDDSKFYNIDDYDIENIRTGVRCPKCRRVGMSRDGKGHKYRCRCGHTVSNRQAVDIVYRMLQVFRVKSIRKCDLNRHLGMPDRTIKRILKQYYNKNGTGRGTYYTKDCVEEE